VDAEQHLRDKLGERLQQTCAEFPAELRQLGFQSGTDFGNGSV
jgi:hypothetical protein